MGKGAIYMGPYPNQCITHLTNFASLEVFNDALSESEFKYCQNNFGNVITLELFMGI